MTNQAFEPAPVRGDDSATAEVSGPVGVPIVMLDPELPAPTYAHPGDAGADLSARHDVVLEPGERALVATGVALALPVGYVGLVHPRSGLAARSGITVLNAPGTIDSGYRGEIKVILINTDRDSAVTIERGDRIAQLLLQRVETARFDVIDSFDDADDSIEDAGPGRGDGGFGSTGGHASAGKDN